MSAATVFFSWQSDRPIREGRNLIERALKTALERIAADIEVDEAPRELVLDKDTLGVAGSPPVFDTILAKIVRASIFVPDLTFVAQRQNGDPIPNANVLIEYGYALKSLGHERIVAVMNTAYGKPKRETMPFDLAHHKFPIPYDVPEGTTDDERKAQREQLARALESAIRDVLKSDAYQSSLTPIAPPKYREPLDGRARFRAKGEIIGFSNDPVNRIVGHKDFPVKLAAGPAMWLRVAPQQPITEPVKISDIQKPVGELCLIPLYKAFTNTFSVRGKDGAGLFPLLDAEAAPTLIYVFTDGEIWTIDTYPFAALPKLISPDEQAFAGSLQRCSTFLSERFGIAGPYRWVAGIEGAYGRLLPIPNNRFGHTRGPCASDLIEKQGSYRIGDDPSEVLEPFFAEVCEQCDVPRNPRKAKPANS
jgi:hypothetical protein